MDIFPNSWIGPCDAVKMTTLSKAMYTFNSIPIRIPLQYFPVIEKQSQNSYGNINDTTNFKEQTRKRKPADRTSNPDPRLHDKDVVMKTAWCWYKNRRTGDETERGLICKSILL